MKMLVDWLVHAGEPEFRVTSSRLSPSMHCELEVIPQLSQPVFRNLCLINSLKWADRHMDRQIYAQMSGWTGKCVFAMVCSYQTGKVEVWTRGCILPHE